MRIPPKVPGVRAQAGVKTPASLMYSAPGTTWVGSTQEYILQGKRSKVNKTNRRPSSEENERTGIELNRPSGHCWESVGGPRAGAASDRARDTPSATSRLGVGLSVAKTVIRAKRTDSKFMHPPVPQYRVQVARVRRQETTLRAHTAAAIPSTGLGSVKAEISCAFKYI